MLHPSQSTGLTPRAAGLCWFVLGVWSVPGLRREPRCHPRGWTDSQTPRSGRVSAGTGRPVFKGLRTTTGLETRAGRTAPMSLPCCLGRVITVGKNDVNV